MAGSRQVSTYHFQTLFLVHLNGVQDLTQLKIRDASSV